MKGIINFNQLRAFYETARHLNFSKAAKVLCVSQPAITSQVKNFEESLSLKLFKKNGRRIILTDEGQTIYDIAHKIFQHEKDLNHTLEEIRQLKRGTLRLGTVKTYARYVMPYLIARFHEIHPNIKIQLDEGSSGEMLMNLMNFKNEMAIVAKMDGYPSVNFIPFSRVELVVITAPDHHLVKKKSITIEELSQEPIIIKEKGSATRKHIDDLFTKRGLPLNIFMETSNPDFIKQLVRQKEGISFLPKVEVFIELQENELTNPVVKGEDIFVDVSMAYLKDQPISKPTQAFIDMINHLPGGIPFERTSALIEKILTQRI